MHTLSVQLQPELSSFFTCILYTYMSKQTNFPGFFVWGFFGNTFIQFFQTVYRKTSEQTLIITRHSGHYPVSGNAEISKTIYGSTWY